MRLELYKVQRYYITLKISDMSLSNLIDIFYNLAERYPSIDLSLVKRELKIIKKMDKKDQYTELINLCRNKVFVHPDWGMLAGNVKMQEIKENCSPTFSGYVLGYQTPFMKEVVEFVKLYGDRLDAMIRHENDYTYNIFAMATFCKSYLTINKDTKKIIETPQYLLMRSALYKWYDMDNPEESLKMVEKAYLFRTNKMISDPSPTLFNSCFKKPQLASCFTANVGDSIEELGKCWIDSAIISQNSGGLGMSYSDIRHSEIGYQGRKSKGILPWLRIQDRILEGVDQGSRRKGSCTVHLHVHHIDIEDFIRAKDDKGTEESMRATGLFYSVVIPDEFMKRVIKDEDWTLFCPNNAKGLSEYWGAEYTMKYIEYEKTFPHARKVKARELLKAICEMQIKVGMPFVVYGDAMNRKSNQQNLGTTKESNLCQEVTLYTDKDNIGSCNLGAVVLPQCVVKRKNASEDHYPQGTDEEQLVFDFGILIEIVRMLTRDINQVIDRNYYPHNIPQIEYTNKRNRPIGIGEMGLADVFQMTDYAWTQPEASILNFLIAESMYYGFVDESNKMAMEYGPYETFEGSPMSKGKFQFDLWDDEAIEKEIFINSINGNELGVSDMIKIISKNRKVESGRYDFDTLRESVKKYGVRNSLGIAYMPTASSSNLLKVNECFEPFTLNLYTRTVLGGSFSITNDYLVKELEELGMWNTEVVRQFIADQGSVQNLPFEEYIDDPKKCAHLREKYKTVYEIPQKLLLQMSLDRGRYTCQSQSFNCHMKDPTLTKLFAYHFYGWLGGAKTGMYYLRQPARETPINFATESLVVRRKRKIVCTEDVCTSCSV